MTPGLAATDNVTQVGESSDEIIPTLNLFVVYVADLRSRFIDWILGFVFILKAFWTSTITFLG